MNIVIDHYKEMSSLPTDYGSVGNFEAYLRFFTKNTGLSSKDISEVDQPFTLFFSHGEPDLSGDLFSRIRKNQPEKLRDKYFNQKIFAEYGFPTLFSEISSETKKYAFPVILKPRIGAGSNKKHINISYKILPAGYEVPYYPECIIQQSIIKNKFEKFNQLYIECFVNSKSETLVSSCHEITFQFGKWVISNQLTQAEIENINTNILPKVVRLVSDFSIKNCCFMVQFLRELGTSVWYPTDWQYRLSYMSLIGRQYFNNPFTVACVKFMSDQLQEVQQDTNYYIQRYTALKKTDTPRFFTKVRDFNTLIIPQPLAPNHPTYEFMLTVTKGATYEQAKALSDAATRLD
jgi:hypothetical protein